MPPVTLPALEGRFSPPLGILLFVLSSLEDVDFADDTDLVLVLFGSLVLLVVVTSWASCDFCFPEDCFGGRGELGAGEGLAVLGLGLDGGVFSLSSAK